LQVAFELGDKHWKLSCGNGQRKPSRYTVEAADTQAVLQCIGKAKAHLGLAPDTPVHSCYEAGRDGWWLHRWLLDNGIDNIVVDSASIEVNRRARRAKNDRLDADKLLSMLMRYHGGETKVWSVAVAPTVEQEDARRVVREQQRLTDERTAHRNRIGSLLLLHNLRVPRVGGRDWVGWWSAHAQKVSAKLREEIERECARLALVRQQVKALEAQKREEVAAHRHPVAQQLARLRAIGETSAWTLDKELFGWRTFANRRDVGGCIGLTPTPYDSGNSQVEQGISKAGNRRLRALLVEVSWGWLRYQPQSELSQWYRERFAGAGSRSRRVGIVALARRLAIALWRYLQTGEIPRGAQLKPA
jgi:transposase